MDHRATRPTACRAWRHSCAGSSWSVSVVSFVDGSKCRRPARCWRAAPIA